MKKSTCMWEGGVYLGIKASTGDHRREPEWGVAHKNGPEEDSERKMRSNLEMIVAVPWTKNPDDAKLDGERRQGDVVMMDKDYQEKL